MCKLWLTLNADGSSSASSTVAGRDRRRLSGTHYHDVHVSQQPALFPTLSPYVSAPFAHPSLGLFAGGRPPHIHLNPTLYPPPRLEPPPTSVYYRPTRNYQGPTKRYSAQHRARSSRTTNTAMDSPVH